MNYEITTCVNQNGRDIVNIDTDWDGFVGKFLNELLAVGNQETISVAFDAMPPVEVLHTLVKPVASEDVNYIAVAAEAAVENSSINFKGAPQRGIFVTFTDGQTLSITTRAAPDAERIENITRQGEWYYFEANADKDSDDYFYILVQRSNVDSVDIKTGD